MTGRTHKASMAAYMAAALVLAVCGTAGAQGDGLGLEDLGLGGLGGLQNLGGLGMLGALGGQMLQGQAAGASAPPVIVSQPTMLIHNGSLYIAYQGKVTKFDAETLTKQAEAWYATPPTGMEMLSAPAGVPTIIPSVPPGAKPPLVPGATPSTGPQ